MQCNLVMGANSGIAKALVAKLIANSDQHIVVISRDISHYQQYSEQYLTKIKVESYSNTEIERTLVRLNHLSPFVIHQIFICHGILHNSNGVLPEKRIEELSAESFQQVMVTNALLPTLWLQALMPMLEKREQKKNTCTIVVFSARVGSISDNQLGGWYSYRASKAALNMMLKTAAIELARRAKNTKLISFHPGTTDTPLSKPFQKNVAQGKLFSCDYVAEQLFSIVEKSNVDGQLSYVDWRGQSIKW